MGCRYFLDLFGQASRDQDLLFQDLLATVMLRCLGIGEVTPPIHDAASGALEGFRHWLRSEQQALYREIGVAMAEFLVTSGQAATAVRLPLDLPLDGADVYQVSNQQILLANAYLRAPGEVREGLKYLEAALSAADDAALEPAERHRLAARAYKERGYYYREPRPVGRGRKGLCARQGWHRVRTSNGPNHQGPLGKGIDSVQLGLCQGTSRPA